MQPANASEQTIFDAARQIPDDRARAAYLDTACAGNPEVRRRLERLLQANARADQFLAADPFELGNPDRQTSDLPAWSEGPGTVIDKYKLLEKLGEGGFGVVYMAEQKEPVKRRVALKIIKVGMDTREVVARFEAERQALALMDHPSIAKVLDAGCTQAPVPGNAGLKPAVSPISNRQTRESGTKVEPVDAPHAESAAIQSRFGSGRYTLAAGRPYFVMELVRGTKITDYCDEKNLSTRNRLDLFIKVCSAVQHAHQKGMIHRDLKPSNILVTVNDGVAVPKIIDFGIAKATQMELTEKTVFTRFQQFLGTPAYMSPEQAELTSVDIDTRSDIYSLGVLLYELLTGKTPFDGKELLKVGLDEMRRTIREKEPERPSTRVGTLRGDELTTTAKRRGLEAPKLASALRGDLDWIVMKCLEKDRARRYETANGLASDIQRHLSNEPVVACPASKLYRLQKLVRRNKLAFALGASVAATLILGLTMATWMYLQELAARQREARLRLEAELARNGEARQRQTAETNELRALANAKSAMTMAHQSRQLNTFFKSMLRGAGPSRAAGRDTAMLRDILDKTTQRIAKDLTNMPEVEIELRGVLVTTYDELGLFEQEEEIARKSLELARSRFPADSDSVSKALYQVAFALTSLGKEQEAEPLALEGVQIRRKRLAELSEGVAELRQELHADVPGDQHKLLSDSLDVAVRDQRELLCASLYKLGHIFFDQRKLHDAELTFRETLAVLRELHAEDNRDVATQLNGLGLTLLEESDPIEAEACLREALGIYRKLYEGKPHPDIAIALENVGKSLKSQGKFNEAEGLTRQALEMAKGMFEPDHREVVNVLVNLAAVVQAQGRLAEVEGLRREVLTIARKLGKDAFICAALEGLASILADEGNLDQAQEAIAECLALRRKLLGSEDVRVAESLASLASLLNRAGQAAEAEPLARECLAIREKQIPDDWRAFNARSLLGESLMAQQKYVEAEPLLVSGFDGIRQRSASATSGAVKPRLKEASQRVIRLYEETNRPEQAAEWKAKMTE
jgi:serine/threonine protein kinase/tetratricopeptide (TPR) repeat protein